MVEVEASASSPILKYVSWCRLGLCFVPSWSFFPLCNPSYQHLHNHHGPNQTRIALYSISIRLIYNLHIHTLLSYIFGMVALDSFLHSSTHTHLTYTCVSILLRSSPTLLRIILLLAIASLYQLMRFGHHLLCGSFALDYLAVV